MSEAVLVVGIGNEYRRDDRVGLYVARRLAGENEFDLRVVAQSGEGVALMEAWHGARNVIVVDAVQANASAGKIFRFDASLEKIPFTFFHYSSHAFGVAEAIELARALQELPPRLILYGIQGDDFGSGNELTPEVELAAGQVVGQIQREIHSWRQPCAPIQAQPTHHPTQQ